MAPVPLLLSPRSRTPPTDYVVVEYLVVAGGGGGGAKGSLLPSSGGGGGAGGILTGTTTLARGVATTVTVGRGSGDNPAANGDGENSILGSAEAIGGGGGGTEDANGRSGGSGGGGGIASSGTTSGGAGTEGQGSAGSGGTTNDAGAGGSALNFGGTSSSITGTATTYATGGVVAESGAAPANSGNGGRGGKVVAGDGIVVGGAGTAGANGTYAVDGTSFLDSPKYRLGATTYYIENDGSSWNIVDGATVLYSLNATPVDVSFYNPYTGPLPAGPATAVNGAAPAPSIAADEVNTEPLAGADGVVVIAYPDTLPALTVSNGLTFTQPTREGYRVYRFTAGSGSISIG